MKKFNRFRKLVTLSVLSLTLATQAAPVATPAKAAASPACASCEENWQCAFDTSMSACLNNGGQTAECYIIATYDANADAANLEPPCPPRN